MREVERNLGIAERLAACLTDARDPSRIDHSLAELPRFRMFAIAADYENADVLPRRAAVRIDPAMPFSPSA